MELKGSVTFFLGHLLQGGAERVVANLANEMAKKNMDVLILSYYDVDSVYQLDDDVKLVRVQKETKSINFLKNLLYIRKVFKERRGTIYSFIAIFNILAVIANFGLNGKLVVADRNDPKAIPKQPYMRLLRDLAYRFADDVVVQTEANGSYFKEKIKTRLHVIYNPLELNGQEGTALIAPKEDVIVSVGRLIRQKNQRMLIDAFAAIHQNFPTYRLIIYGEGDSRAELENHIADLGLSEAISLPGNTTNIYDMIKCARLFVLTSNFEGMPNALIEAMGLGLPVISTKVSGATDLIIDGKNGELIPVGDKDLLKERMVAILSDEKLQQQYGAEAKAICTSLDKNTIVDEWINIYEDR